MSTLRSKQRGAGEFFSSSRRGGCWAPRDLAWGVDNAASLREGKSIWESPINELGWAWQTVSCFPGLSAGHCLHVQTRSAAAGAHLG